MLSIPLMIVIGLIALLALSQKQSAAPSSLVSAVTSVPVARSRSQREVEDDEDLATVAEFYRDHRKSERAKEAMTRVANLAAGKK